MPANQEKLRMAVVFRTDIDIPRGKAEVQAGHAFLMSFMNVANRDQASCDAYLSSGQMKISFDCDGVDEINRIAEIAKRREVPHYIVIDAGHTVFEGPTVTCIGIGPTTKTHINAITRGLSMRRPIQ